MRFLARIVTAFPNEWHPVQPRPPAADHAEVMTADGYSERSGFEPQISRMARMHATLV